MLYSLVEKNDKGKRGKFCIHWFLVVTDGDSSENVSAQINKKKPIKLKGSVAIVSSFHLHYE